jgi:hypothetical protein
MCTVLKKTMDSFRISTPGPSQTTRMRRLHSGSVPRSRRAQDDEHLKKDSSRRGGPKRRAVLASISTLLLLLYLVPLPDSLKNLQSLTKDVSHGVSLEVAPGVRLLVDFGPIKDAAAEAEAVLSLGPHTAKLLLERPCDNPKFWLRAEGDALVTVNLSASSNSDNSMSGTFAFPIAGKYELVGYWYGCGSETKQVKIRVKSVTATGTAVPISNTTTSMYPPSAWISSKKFSQFDSQTTTQPYIWHDPQVSPASATLLKTGSTILSKEGTVSQSGFYDFESLSNYELVCWVGSESAQLLRNSFMQVRPLLFKHQRPFKFHMYPIDYFEKPDRNWEEATKPRLRKCKHILVSLDELKQPVSQSEYINQVQTFINHLLKVMPDETFPIWMFTVFESPAEASNCLPQSLPRTSDHPCNVALKSLFQDSPFPKRVQLLDTTELVLPQLGENKADVAAAIALRIYVFVGKKVQEWRDKGQKGTVSGLERGGKTEPNSEMVPYTGWS